jgi:soluble lytic murein transglycosylase
VTPTPPYRRTPILLAVACLCLGALWQAAARPSPAPPPPAPAPGFDPVPLAASLDEAAGELRHRGPGCARAMDAAAAAAKRAGEPAREAFFTLVEGLYAHACEDVARAEDRLAAAAPSAAVVAAAAAPLEDWRLLVLADSAAAAGHPSAARAALDRLLDRLPESPLRPHAYLEAARLARDGGDAGTALALVERARREGVGETPAGAAEGARLEELAWEIGEAAAEPAVRLAVQRAAARRLLVHHPLRAEELTATSVFRDPAEPSAPVEWAAVLSPDELVRRASNLLAAGAAQPAARALTAVPLAHRGLEWRLLTAEALTEGQEGMAAVQLLAEPGPLTPAQAARVEWRRALASFEAARVRRGRPPLPAERREELRRQALGHLAAAARQGSERDQARLALRRLFVELWDAERVEESLLVLARLREIDPEDLTGARPLWQAGWQQFERGNPTGAIGYWSELAALYPESGYTRNGRYWTARAHDELGNPERADAIYREVVAADTGDFYTGYALARLGDGVAPAAAASPLADDRGIPWPWHEDLGRARLLTDLGLDDLARAELAAVAAGGGDPFHRRAAVALEALILAREGDTRASIRRIYDAFPTLGGPLQATAPGEALRLYFPLSHAGVIRREAEARALDPYLVYGMVRQESAFDTEATSIAGARGLMQLMPATSREVAGKLGLRWTPARLADPEFNVTLGTAYFRQVLAIFDGDVELALAGYNGGPYRIKRLWREAPPRQARDVFIEGLAVPESRLYVKRILMHRDSYRQLYPEAGGA